MPFAILIIEIVNPDLSLWQFVAGVLFSLSDILKVYIRMLKKRTSDF